MKRNRSTQLPKVQFNQENFAGDSERPSIDNAFKRCCLENKIVEEFFYHYQKEATRQAEQARKKNFLQVQLIERRSIYLNDRRMFTMFEFAKF